MAQYMAFLRAINVGGRRVKMDHLRTLFEALGFANVSTFIASGNVVFETTSSETPALERMIEEHLLESLGYEVDTFVRTSEEVAAIADHEPFSMDELAEEDNWLYVAFLQQPLGDEAQAQLMALRTDVDDFHVNETEAFWLRRRNVGESEFSAAALEKAIGAPTTMRNMNTVRRMVTKYVA